MVAQNPDKGNCGQHVFVEHQLPDLKAQLDGLQQWILQAAQNGSSARDVERGLFDMVLALGKTLFQKFLQLVGPGDWGNDVTLDDGRVVHRSKEQHQRRQMTVFGACTVSRWVYAQRDKAKIEFCPTDQRLQLPASEVSYLLQEWDQLLGVEHAFGKVREVIETILRLSQSVDTLENTNQQMAAAAPLFRKEQAPVDLSKEGELLIVTEDNKGIPMVRPVEEKPTGAHRTKGEKANKKQMACIGCIYSVDPHVRTPEQLVATLFRDPDRPTEQAPRRKTSVTGWNSVARSRMRKFGAKTWCFNTCAEISTRRKPGQWLIHLCDGQESLATDRQAYLPEDTRTIDILDLMHVLPRVWEAAHVFHKEGSDPACEFVRAHLTQILHGKVGKVITSWRRKATRKDLPATKRRAHCARSAIFWRRTNTACVTMNTCV